MQFIKSQTKASLQQGVNKMQVACGLENFLAFS